MLNVDGVSMWLVYRKEYTEDEELKDVSGGHIDQETYDDVGIAPPPPARNQPQKPSVSNSISGMQDMLVVWAVHSSFQKWNPPPGSSLVTLRLEMYHTACGWPCLTMVVLMMKVNPETTNEIEACK